MCEYDWVPFQENNVQSLSMPSWSDGGSHGQLHILAHCKKCGWACGNSSSQLDNRNCLIKHYRVPLVLPFLSPNTSAVSKTANSAYDVTT
jgi:hypothetical protein